MSTTPPAMKATSTHFYPPDPPCSATVMATWIKPGEIGIDFSGYEETYSSPARILHRFFWISPLFGSGIRLDDLKEALESLTSSYKDSSHYSDIRQAEGKLLFDPHRGYGYYWFKGKNQWICRGPMDGKPFTEGEDWVTGYKSNLVCHIVGLSYLYGLISENDPRLDFFNVKLELE